MSRKRNLLTDYVFEVLRDTTLQGFVHFTYPNRHPLEYAVWVVVVVGAMSGAIAICLSTWGRFQSTPTVVSMEHNYLEWPFVSPSTYFCPAEVVDPYKLDVEAKRLVGPDADNATLDRMKLFLTTVVNATYDNFWKLAEFAEDTNLPQSGYLDLAIKVNFNFFYLSMGLQLDETITELGICYAYNSMVANYTSPNPELRKKLKHPRPLYQTGVLEAGTFDLISNINSNYSAYLQSPNAIPDILKSVLHVGVMTKSDLRLAAVATYSTDAVLALSIKQRKCRTDDESDLKYSSVYSMSHCKVQCRMELALKLCQCLPFFYNVSSEKECDVKGMLCLAKYNESLLFLWDETTGEKFPCSCLPSCEQFDYTILEVDIQMAEKFMGAALHTTEITSPSRIRIKRDVLFSSIDLMVSFGGAVGLFLGSSVLSFVEIPYYITLRLFFYIRRKKRQE